MPSTEKIEQFIERWQQAGGSERANHQLFVAELCAALDLPPPDPAEQFMRAQVKRAGQILALLDSPGLSCRDENDCYLSV